MVIAAELWGKSWERRRILFRTDNQAVFATLKSGLSHDRHLAFCLLELELQVILNNFTFSAVLIPGKVNKASDALSRFHFKEFKSIVPDANSASLYVPPLLLHKLPVSALDSEWIQLMSMAWAPSTIRTYCSAQRQFLNFCKQFSQVNQDKSILPASEITILRFIAYAGRRLSASSVRNYLSAVRNLHLVFGFPDPMKGSPSFERT